MYDYNCQVVRMLDGDTVELVIDLGFNCLYKSTARLKGINAPEITGPTKPQGEISKEALRAFLKFDLGSPCPVLGVTEFIREKDKYGRVLVTLTKDGLNVNQAMLDGGFAVVYMNT